MSYSNKLRPRISSVRGNIIAIAMTVSTLVALIMFIGVLVVSQYLNRSTFAEELKNLTASMAVSTKYSLIADDKLSAQQILSTFEIIPHITYAELKHADGETVAVYQRSEYSPSLFANIFGKPIVSQQSVATNGQHMGSLTVTSSAEQAVEQAIKFSIFGSIVAVLALLAAYVLTQLLQRRISSPLHKLKTAMNRSTGRVDSYFQLPVEQKDEAGDLLNSFNLMMDRFSEQQKVLDEKASSLSNTVDMRNQQISEEERKRILWLQNLARFLKHELKNTMLGFRSSLDMIERRSNDPKITQYIDRARGSVIFMGKLLHNVGETSSLEAELLEEDYDVVDLAHVIKDWLEEYTQATGYTNLKLTADEKCRIEGNPVRLKQLAEKLVANAETYSAEGTDVEITVERFDHEVTFSVANQGIPLPDDQDGIFDLFVSMRETGHQTDDNIGLGLYIVRLIAEAHDGYVEASNLGDAKGAVFKVHFPIYGLF